MSYNTIVRFERVGLCLAGGLGLTSQSLMAITGDSDKKTHIILIMRDQQRGDALECAGHEAATCS